VRNFLTVFQRINDLNKQDFYREAFSDKMLKVNPKQPDSDEDYSVDSYDDSQSVSPQCLRVTKHTYKMMRTAPKLGI